MKITKGKKTITDYILKGGLCNKYFSYGWGDKEGPAIYQVKNIDREMGHGLRATLKVIRIDRNKKEEKELNLAIHRKDLEVFLN